MTIKAVVLDIDGTLLNNDKQITARTQATLIRAQQQGMMVILASGRPTTGMLSYVKELALDKYEGLLIAFNGASVVDCKTKKELFNQPIPIDTAKAILEYLKQFDVIPMIFDNEYMYVTDVFANISSLPNGETSIIRYEARGGNFKLQEVDDLAAFVDFPLNKILVAAEPEVLQANYQAIKAPFEQKVSGVFSAPVYFEFTDQGIDKAKTLDTVLSQFSLRSDEVIAFGDGHNDCSIIEYAGIGVAMGNAVEELKAVADVVTLSNNEDGIAVVLEKYL